MNRSGGKRPRGWTMIDRDGSVKRFGDRGRAFDDQRQAVVRAWGRVKEFICGLWPGGERVK